MTDIETRFKPEPFSCPCGCLVVGRPRRKAWQDGLGPHVRLCPCIRCRGSRTKQRSTKREKRIAQDIGGERSYASGVLSGCDVSGPCDVEETAHLRYAAGIRRWWNSKGVQTKTARLYARNNGMPKAFVLTDETPWLVVMTYPDWVQAFKMTED